MSRLTDALLTELRDVVDENNTADLSDAELLRFLNRAQKRLARLVSRHAPHLFTRTATVAADGNRAVDVPDLSLGFTVNDVAVQSGSSFYSVKRMPLRTMTDWDGASSSSLPLYYSTVGRQIYLYPTATSGTSVRVRYQYRPPDLVPSQGRITAVGVTGAGGSPVAVTLDAIGSELSTNVSSLAAFVNVVDGLTGEIKGTLQISDIATSTKTVTFKSASLDRDVVFGLDVSSSLPADLAEDDYICLASGVCIPMLFQDYDDFLIASAAVEVKKKLGESVQEDLANLSNLEEDLRLMWAGREAFKKVERLSKHWR